MNETIDYVLATSFTSPFLSFILRKNLIFTYHVPLPLFVPPIPFGITLRVMDRRSPLPVSQSPLRYPEGGAAWLPDRPGLSIGR